MMSLVRPELPTASVGSSQATTAAVDNSALFAICPKSTYKSGNAVQTSGATSFVFHRAWEKAEHCSIPQDWSLLKTPGSRGADSLSKHPSRVTFSRSLVATHKLYLRSNRLVFMFSSP